MVIPFSNTKLRVPKGFQSLLVGLSTEVLRSQPRNIHEFAADYFEKLLKRRDQGQSYLPEQQSTLEDRYYNNQSFQEDFPVNDPEINHAATKIQAKFRGHKARQNVEKLKQDNQPTIDPDQQELGYNRQESATPSDSEKQSTFYQDQEQKSSESLDTTTKEETDKIDKTMPVIEPDEPFPEELTEEEKVEMERAARSIQARFRGFQAKKSATQSPTTPDRQSARQQLESDNEKASTVSSARLSGKLDSDRQDLGGNLTANDQNETGENDDTDRPRLEREPTQLSEDFERHTQVPRDSEFDREQQQKQPDFNNEDDDMNDPNLDKAATRIQASFRGYKTRKQLSSAGSQDHPQHPSSTSPHTYDEFDNAQNKTEGNKELETEEDDTAAAVKIQAAFRGYKTRKDLEK